jgi:hypothetical protein
MATRKQVQAAKRNVKKAQAGARKKRTIANLPKSVRSDLGKQALAVGRVADARATRSRIATVSSCTSSRSGATSRAARGWARAS